VMLASTCSTAPAAPAASLAVAAPRSGASPELGPLAWVFDELRHCLDEAAETVQRYVADNEAARCSDWSEVDGGELRLLVQQLHQAVGALDLVDLSAAAQTLRALEAALQRLLQKPALATPVAAQTVRQGCHALQDYLLRLLRQRPVADLALFATYRDWQQLAGAARIHPADLWRWQAQSIGLPPGPALAAQPALRQRLERLVLALLQGPNPAAALAAAQLAAALARGAAAGPARQFWSVAAAGFEALAAGLLPDSVWVKRALSGTLSQYQLWSQGQEQGLAAAAHDWHYLLAQVVPDAQDPAQAHLRALWQAQGWPPPTPWDLESRVLGRYDPARLAQAQAAVQSAQSAWERGTEAGVPLFGGVTLARLGQTLAKLLPQNSEPTPKNSLRSHPSSRGQETLGAARRVSHELEAAAALQELAHAWAELARLAQADAAAWPAGLALEVCHGLLLLGAELANFDPCEAELGQRLRLLTQLLRSLHADVLLTWPTSEPLQVPETAEAAQAAEAVDQATIRQRLGSNLSALGASLEAMPRQPEGNVPVLRQAVALPPLLEQPLKLVGPLRIELDLFNVFLAEAEDWSCRLSQAVAAWIEGQPELEPPPAELAELAHSLAGAAATVEYSGLAQLVRALEQSLERLAATYPPHSAAAPGHAQAQAGVVLLEAMEQVRRLLHQFAAGFLREPSADTLAALAALAAPAARTQADAAALPAAGA